MLLVAEVKVEWYVLLDVHGHFRLVQLVSPFRVGSWLGLSGSEEHDLYGREPEITEDMPLVDLEADEFLQCSKLGLGDLGVGRSRMQR